MANEKDPQALPAVEIPDLKKKKEERKKSGVAGEFPGEGTGTFNGARGAATVGSRAAASAAARTVATEAVQVAESVAGSQGGFLSQLLARLAGSPLFQAFLRFSGTLLGKVAIGLACAAIVAAVGAMLKGGSPSAGPGGVGSAGDLGGIKSTIKVHMPGNKALDYAARASNGALKFGEAKKTAAAPTPPPAAPTKEAVMPEGKDPEFAGRPEMPHGNFEALSGAKLSTGFGDGASGASFGKNDVFGSGPKIASVDKGKISNFGQSVRSSAHGGMARSAARGSRAMAFRGGRMSKAMGQLRGMGPIGSEIKKDLAANAGEAASADATKQWEGAGPTAAAPEGPAGLSGAGPAGGPSGMPDIGNPNAPAMLHPPVDISACTQTQINNGYTISSDNTCDAPKNAGNTNDTPWQSLVEISNVLNTVASISIVISGACALIAQSGAVFTKWLAIVAMVFAILGLICSIGAIGCAIGIAAMGGGMQAFGSGIGGAMNLAMSIIAILNVPTGTQSATMGQWMGVIMGFLGAMTSLVPMLMKGPDPNAQTGNMPTIQDEGMLPPPDPGMHWESPTPNDPNPKDYKEVPNGDPPGNAPAGTQWVHDPADSGWSLMPASSVGPDGKPLPALPPGEHYESGKPAQDGLAPYAPPAGDHWEHQDVPNSDPNAWVLYDSNGKQVGNSAGVDPNGDIYNVNTSGPNATQTTGSASGGNPPPLKDPNYPPCATQGYVSNGNGQSMPNPNCSH